MSDEKHILPLAATLQHRFKAYLTAPETASNMSTLLSTMLRPEKDPPRDREARLRHLRSQRDWHKDILIGILKMSEAECQARVDEETAQTERFVRLVNARIVKAKTVRKTLLVWHAAPGYKMAVRKKLIEVIDDCIQQLYQDLPNLPNETAASWQADRAAGHRKQVQDLEEAIALLERQESEIEEKYAAFVAELGKEFP